MTAQFIQIFQNLGISVVILICTFLLRFLFNRYYKKFIQASSVLIQNDPTNYKFIGHAVSGVIYTVGFSLAILQIEALRTVANSLLAGAGILAVAVGFASNHALSNIISGMFIVIFKPFRVNDRLQIRGNLHGIVEDITLRHTVIRDFDNKRIIIPNAVISDEIIVNSDYAGEPISRKVDFYVSHKTDIALAKKIMKAEIISHPLFLDIRKPEDIEAGKDIVTIKLVEIRELGIVLRAWTWTADSTDSYNMYCALLESIKLQFDKNNIQFPDHFLMPKG